MNTATFRTVANSLIVGAVIGFVGGAWTVQTTHSNKAVLGDYSRDDMTANAILSSLSRIHTQCADIEHQSSAKETSKPVTKPPEARRASLLTMLNP